MIKSNLPPIMAKRCLEDGVEWQLRIDADLPYFEGHFPEQAVLPGVTQLDWAVQLGASEFGYAPQVQSLEVLKFQQLILPGSEVQLKISLNRAKHKLTFAYYQGEQRFGSGRICLTPLDKEEKG
ncbi:MULTISPECIES: ApeI family dehydratase [Shewanella]|uniref:ApeI family dehydratase n=1 Tax=Shewanella TaxID=22 RepID=UPI001C65770F|nr:MULTISPECIES: thioester dehydrase [Shewanella]QYJ82152.1 thioester dehydrase [Shewanella aegiceratis]QYJ97373.1 thioester dehydrase [Shewanella alkalitolerans]